MSVLKSAICHLFSFQVYLLIKHRFFLFFLSWQTYSFPSTDPYSLECSLVGGGYDHREGWLKFKWDIWMNKETFYSSLPFSTLSLLPILFIPYLHYSLPVPFSSVSPSQQQTFCICRNPVTTYWYYYQCYYFIPRTSQSEVTQETTYI